MAGKTSLKTLAKKEGGIKENGELSASWMRKKLADSKTTAPTKKKILAVLNGKPA